MFFSIGIFHIVSGKYFGVTIPVRARKIIGAQAITTSLTAGPLPSPSFEGFAAVITCLLLGNKKIPT
ncbi:MAG: hypothetical protein ACLFV2_06925 [Desulfurivibrionaceae bacterium]